LAHNQEAVGSNPTPAIDLSGGVESRHDTSSIRTEHTSPPSTRGQLMDSGISAPPAPKLSAKHKPNRTKKTNGLSRIAALRLSQERVANRESKPSDRAWYREGQYA
jgi:hypothetical protein